MKIKSIMHILAGVFVILSLGFVGAMDAADAEIEFKAYCNDLKEGIHPDYNNLQDECGKLD